MTIRTIFLAASMIVLAACQTTKKANDTVALPATPSDASVITDLDTEIFNAVFLSCDEGRLRELMSPDLEFYHDKYGVIARDIDEFLEGTITDCQDRQSGKLPYLERRLTSDTMQVRQIGQDALMQTGEHSFWLREPGEDIKQVERGTFLHIWERSDDGWMLTRVVSYDHFNTEG